VSPQIEPEGGAEEGGNALGVTVINRRSGAALACLVNSVLAGVTGVYIGTGSVIVVVIAAGLALEVARLGMTSARTAVPGRRRPHGGHHYLDREADSLRLHVIGRRFCGADEPSRQ
jgi:hypothetical protein